LPGNLHSIKKTDSEYSLVNHKKPHTYLKYLSLSTCSSRTQPEAIGMDLGGQGKMQSMQVDLEDEEGSNSTEEILQKVPNPSESNDEEQCYGTDQE